jgi:release factor glutamine methyltransferase
MRTTVLSGQKIRALVSEGESTLAAGPHPERARRDAESLFLHVLKKIGTERNTAWLLGHLNDPTDHAAEFKALIQRRLAGEPIQYITNETEFYGLPFLVSPDVLIPRPETEHLVEKVLELAAGFPVPRIPVLRIVDIGTGSGAIAIAIARHLPHASISAIDHSNPALAIAQENANRNGVAVRFLQGDLLNPVANEQFDIVVSNPPYVPTADRDSLSVEVRDHEPPLALFAGPDGLDIYRRLFPQSFACLVPGGFIVLEIGYGQSQPIADLLASSGLTNIEFVPDLQSIPRVAVAQHP